MHYLRLETLAAWLEAGDEYDGPTFDMSLGLRLSECGTRACLAGTAVQFFDPAWRATFANLPSAGGQIDWPQLKAKARNLLGLSPSQADRLFEPKHNSHTFQGSEADNLEMAWAARTIRHLIATGEANWDATYIRGESK